jgi:lauroyl/myristoyl acyltransferase
MLTESHAALIQRLGLRSGGPLWRALAYVGSRYGPRPWLRYSPPMFGWAVAAAQPESRRMVRENLRRVLGPRLRLEEDLDVARTFSNYAHCLAEALATGRREADHPRCLMLGRDRIREVSAGDAGFLVATAHVGAWDSAARMLARDTGRSVKVIMEAEADDRAQRLHDHARGADGVDLSRVQHPLDVLPLLRHLERGGVVAAQIDRVPKKMRRFTASLFGQPFEVPQGPFRLAAATGCPIVPVFAARTGHFEYEIHVGPVLRLPRRADEPTLLRAAVAACQEMERFIRIYPTQWFHFDDVDDL